MRTDTTPEPADAPKTPAGYAGCPQCNGTRRTISNSSCYTCGWVDTLLAGQREAQQAGKEDELAAAGMRWTIRRHHEVEAQLQASTEEIARLNGVIDRLK